MTGVASSEGFLQHQGSQVLQKGIFESLQNEAPKVVQNAEFLLQMTEALIFNAATMCFAVTEATFKRFDSAGYTVPG